MKYILGLLTAVFLLLFAAACASENNGAPTGTEASAPQGPALVVFYTDN